MNIVSVSLGLTGFIAVFLISNHIFGYAKMTLIVNSDLKLFIKPEDSVIGGRTSMHCISNLAQKPQE